jgi:hypothetical protein
MTLTAIRESFRLPMSCGKNAEQAQHRGGKSRIFVMIGTLGVAA